MATPLNRLRLRIAQAIAPMGADVHDPDDTACPDERAFLEAAEAYDLYPDADGRARLDVTDTAKYAEEAGWVALTTDYDGNAVYQLTGAGESQLARLRQGKGAQ
jgi:hypothetical protein